MALLDLSSRSATVCAAEDSVALAIDAGLLYHLYRQAPESYTIILMNLGRELSRRLRAADERLSRLLEGGGASGVEDREAVAAVPRGGGDA
jgi:CRP-like cAMP-binding protein